MQETDKMKNFFNYGIKLLCDSNQVTSPTIITHDMNHVSRISLCHRVNLLYGTSKVNQLLISISFEKEKTFRA